MAEWFTTQLNRFCDLDKSTAREDVLIELKIKFAGLSEKESTEIAKTLDLTRLFTELTSNDVDYVQQTCDTLSTISRVSGPGHILFNYTSEIYKLITHELLVVKIYALEEILKVSSNPSILPELLKKVDLLNLVVETISDKHITVAKYAMDILKAISKDPDGLKLIYSGTILRSIAKLISIDDTVKFRVYEVVVDIAKQNKECLEASINSGFLQSLVDMLEKDDILVQLNVLQTLTELAVTQEGLEYLEKQKVLSKLAEKIRKSNENPLSNLYIPGLMKFFGNVARVWPNEIFAKYPAVVTALFDVFQTDDQIILAIALDTLGHISSTVKGKYALQDFGDVMISTLKKIANIIKTSSSQLKLRGLNSLALIFNVEKSEQDNRILTLVKSWFDSLCEDPMKMIVSQCQQPFADIRQAGLEVLAVLASQDWSQEYISNHPGLVEFLLDRNIETFKECKEVKFTVVKNLVDSATNIFDVQTIQKFKQFISEGPFYVDIITEIAIEGAS